jgi:phage tail sheath protein FI
LPEYLTPGVYHERVDAGPGITAVRTDIAGFVGLAPRGPLDTPVPVQSWRQYQSYFGGCSGSGYLAYAVRGFFENGGRRCWVVRVASREPLGGSLSATFSLPDSAGQPAWQVQAYSAGQWGNHLTVWLTETHQAQTVSIPRYSAPEYSAVASITGFRRGSHVRVTQGTASVYKVVSGVDADEQQLIWVNPDTNARLPYDSPLAGFDPDQPVLIESVEYTLQVREDGRLGRVYEGLSLVPEHPRYGPGLLQGVRVPQPGDAVQTMPVAPEPVLLQELRAVEDFGLSSLQPLHADSLGSWFALSGGSEGLRQLAVYDFMGEDFDPLDSDQARARKKRGLRALEEISEVAILAVPDIHIQPVPPPTYSPLPVCVPDPCLPSLPQPPRSHPDEQELPPVFGEDDLYRVQAAMILQCERLRDRIALLDTPYSASRQGALGPGAVQAWRRRFESKYAAFYYPWLRVVDPLRGPGGLTRDVPPSGHVAGQYAHTDFTIGVHKAPANDALKWVQDVTAQVNDGFHGVLNPLGINAIRSLPGRGIRVFGARTTSSDPDWKFVNVRRLLMMIEKAVDHSTQWAAFEPNDLYTRSKLTLSLTSFLLALWQRGALAGKAAEEAFFVKCDEELNPPEARDNGQLLAVVGVAPAQPFEFVVLRVGRVNNAFEISETAVDLGGG